MVLCEARCSCRIACPRATRARRLACVWPFSGTVAFMRPPRRLRVHFRGELQEALRVQGVFRHEQGDGDNAGMPSNLYSARDGRAIFDLGHSHTQDSGRAFKAVVCRLVEVGACSACGSKEVVDGTGARVSDNAIIMTCVHTCMHTYIYGRGTAWTDLKGAREARFLLLVSLLRCPGTPEQYLRDNR